MAKVDFTRLQVGDDKKILEQQPKLSEEPVKVKNKHRKSSEDKLVAQIKVNLTLREKEQLEQLAKHNISAFVREVLQSHGYINND